MSARKKTNFCEVDLDFAAINAEAMKKAVRADSDTWEPPTLTDPQKLVCLERWHHRGGFNGEIKSLWQLEPSGLTDKESRDWYWGLRQEAVYKMICILNSSYSKTEVKRKLKEEGLQDIFVILNQDLIQTHDAVVKYLSD